MPERRTTGARVKPCTTRVTTTTEVVRTSTRGRSTRAEPLFVASGMDSAAASGTTPLVPAQVSTTGIRRLEELSELEAVPDVVLDRLRRGLTARRDDARDRLADDDGHAVPVESADLVYRQLRRDLIAVEALALQRLYDEHAISDTTRRRLQRSLDLEEARLTDA